jgi:hypothetical protein
VTGEQQVGIASGFNPDKWTEHDEMTDGEMPECRTCEGEGVVLYCCEADDCPANCGGHEFECPHCAGTGVRK